VLPGTKVWKSRRSTERDLRHMAPRSGRAAGPESGTCATWDQDLEKPQVSRSAGRDLQCNIVISCFFSKDFLFCVGPPLGAAFRISTFDHAAALAVRARSVILGRPSGGRGKPRPYKAPRSGKAAGPQSGTCATWLRKARSALHAYGTGRGGRYARRSLHCARRRCRINLFGPILVYRGCKRKGVAE